MGVLACDSAALTPAEARVAGEFSPIVFGSQVLPFTHTSYYAPELGTDILRQWLLLSELVNEDELARIKLRTNQLEQALAVDREGGKVRTANLDPGLLSFARLVLASTKRSPHRVYLGEGIHAEITLVFESGCYRPVPWTYRDYATPAAIEFFGRAREWLKKRLREPA